MEAKALLDSLDVGLVAIAPDWTIAEWTAPAALITGLPAERALGQNFWMVFPTAKGTPIERTLLDVADDGQARTYVSPAPGSAFPGMVVETRVTRGPRNHLILLFRQVREELEPEARTTQLLTAFETERRLYLRLFHALPIPALVLALDGQIVEANAAGSALLGAANSDGLVGRSLADWLGAERRGALASALRDATLRPQRIQVALELGGEPVREVEAVITNVDAADQAAKVLFLAVEVSREVLLQRKLLHADRLSQLGALVSGVAHELNNPLAAIAAFAELLAVDANTAELKESAEIIHTEAIRAGRVVQTLLDFARQRPHRREAVDLKDIVERVLALHRSALKKSRARTTVQIDDRVPAVLGDTQELQQVVLNAVVNAEQAIAAGGKPGTIAISARRVDDQVVLVVEDSGPGVPPEIVDRVFEPFFTTKGEGGTGLGLSISLGLVRGMGGRMYLHNMEEGGVRLGIELPAESAATERERDPEFRAAPRPLSVLVVEDEQGVRRGMVRMAERLGHRVTAVAGYKDALQRLYAADGHFDALLFDVHLDEAHTGFDLFAALLSEGRGRERHVVFTTGDSISAKTRDALQRAEQPILKKPFNLDELREILERVAS